MRASQPTKPGPVAVIAVHGVADQQRDQTAVCAANLLLHVSQVELDAGERAGARPAYTGFEQETIRVGVEPLHVSGMGEEDAWQFQLRRHLENYRGDGTESYETVRMEGQRLTRANPDEDPKPERGVHVYELYWADASRLPIGILNLFLGIYRLLFQTSWLGVQTIGRWATFGKDVSKWSILTSPRGPMLLLNHVCSMFLTRFMPLLYLYMVSLLLLMAVPVVESSWARGLLGGLGGYPGLFALDVVLVVAALLIAGSAKVWKWLPWPALYGVVAIVSFLAWNFAFVIFQDQAGSWRAEAGVALATWGVVCLLVALFVIPVIGKRFPGSAAVGYVLMGYFTLFLFLGLMRRTEWPLLISGPMLALRMGFALLPFAWIILATSANLFLVLAALESISFWFRRWLDPEDIRRKRARLRTAAISIILPVLLISFLNSTFFLLALVPYKAGLVDGAAPVRDRMADVPAWVQPVGVFVEQHIEPFAAKWSNMPSFHSWAEARAGQDVRFSDFVNYASQRMVVPFLEAVFLAVLLVMGYSLWVVAPAVIAEHAYRRPDKSAKAERVSQALGKNLSQGYRWLWAGQVVLALCLLATQAMFFYRGIRTREIQRTDPHYVHQGPVMTLVDQFLASRHLGDSAALQGPALALAEAAPPAAAATAAGTPQLPPVQPGRAQPVTAPPSSLVARPPAPVAEVTPLGSPAGRSAPRALPYLPGKPSTQPWQGLRGGPPRMRSPMAQQAFEQRQEVRHTIENIFKRKDNTAAHKGPQPRSVTPQIATAAEKTEGDPPGLLIKALSEAVLFLNTGPLTSALGVCILALSVGYFFFARLMDPIVAGLRGGLDIALDVLNYLRPRPLDETPRARILSRYASLLRYIVSWRDPRDPDVGYSRIVILAHSQGSVITSDILRALSLGSVAGDNDLERLRAQPGSGDGIPIRVFTMGSPLRQLYAARFPDLYAWDPAADPRLSHRGVESWWNVYRSGDYVGRMLFRDENDKERFAPGREFRMRKDGKDLPIREYCMGPGAHTHYWDETAPMVIRDLDRLIACDDAEDLCSSAPAKRAGAT